MSQYYSKNTQSTSDIFDRRWTDIDPVFKRAWNNDVAASTGVAAINNSILGIITTRRGSRPFNPDFGCDLSDQLFENMNPAVGDNIKQNIRFSIETWEPRVTVTDVDVKQSYDSNSIEITVFYSIKEIPSDEWSYKITLSPGDNPQNDGRRV